MTSFEERLKFEAHARGFGLAGIAPATEADGFGRFTEWLDRGFAGEMDYLHEQREERRHPRSVLENVRSVLMLGMEYRPGREHGPHAPRAANAGPHAERADHTAKVALYAQGPEYHRFIWDRMNDLAAWFEAESPGHAARAVADTAPLLERDFARRAGLGWIGKNTLLIHPLRGSFFFLGAVLTDRELQADPPFATSHCGTCTACLDACPTAAFPEPHVLDATRCISYLTIELRSPIPEALREPMGNWLYGCDVCQDVCPWNRKAPVDSVFPHDPGLESLDPVELLGLSDDQFRVRFKKTSLWRNRRPGLLRNAAIVLGNVGDESALPVLRRALEDDPLIAEAAAWAIAKIESRLNAREAQTSPPALRGRGRS